jgi:outer membrane lipoprotein
MVVSQPPDETHASSSRLASVAGQRPLLMLMAVIALVGCAASVPSSIRDDPVTQVTVAEVQQAPDQFIGAWVRWGGTIIGVANLENRTQIEVLSRPLDGEGEPRPDAAGQGRFIAEVPGFVDPADYRADRLLTIFGQVTGLVTRDVGEYPYPYPVVAASSRYLWPEVEPMPDVGYRYPWYGWYGYPPWYGPFGPWYGPAYGPWWW